MFRCSERVSNLFSTGVHLLRRTSSSSCQPGSSKSTAFKEVFPVAISRLERQIFGERHMHTSLFSEEGTCKDVKLSNNPVQIGAEGPRDKALERLLQLPPSDLRYSNILGTPKDGWEDSQVGRALLWMGGYYSKESQSVRGGKRLFEVTKEHAANKDIRDGLMLEDTFPCTQGLISLHVWMCLSRLRQEGRQGKRVSQVLYDLFQEDVEVRVRDAGVKVRISKWLVELEQRFLGAAVAYDKAMQIQDMDQSRKHLMDALWRNVYNGEGDQSGARLLQRYVRRELACLAMTDSESILSGQIRFSLP